MMLFNRINLTDQQLTEDELNVCKLRLKFKPTVKRYDRVKKWMETQALKRKVRLLLDTMITFRLFLDTMEKELSNLKKENRVRDNLKTLKGKHYIVWLTIRNI